MLVHQCHLVTERETSQREHNARHEHLLERNKVNRLSQTIAALGHVVPVQNMALCSCVSGIGSDGILLEFNLNIQTVFQGVGGGHVMLSSGTACARSRRRTVGAIQQPAATGVRITCRPHRLYTSPQSPRWMNTSTLAPCHVQGEVPHF